MKKEVDINTKASLILFLTIAIVITLASALFPAGVVFSGYYKGINYHGFPAAWMGEAGPNFIENAVQSLPFIGYLMGFLFDLVVWFFAAIVLYVLSQEGALFPKEARR